MDIHVPHGVVRTLKEFATHILIVTIGILIALGLEGVRESIHEKHLVRETRESFSSEIAENRAKLLLEIENLEQTRNAIDDSLAQLTGQKPRSESPIAAIKPAFYSFRSTSWQTALSTGAMAYMEPAEVVHYSESYQGTTMFSGLEEKALAVFFEIEAIGANPKLTQQDDRELASRLRILNQHEAVLHHVAKQVLSDYDSALRQSH